LLGGIQIEKAARGGNLDLVALANFCVDERAGRAAGLMFDTDAVMVGGGFVGERIVAEDCFSGGLRMDA
jgi:hypothetical protein